MRALTKHVETERSRSPFGRRFSHLGGGTVPLEAVFRDCPDLDHRSRTRIRTKLCSSFKNDCQYIRFALSLKSRYRYIESFPEISVQIFHRGQSFGRIDVAYGLFGAAYFLWFFATGKCSQHFAYMFVVTIHSRKKFSILRFDNVWSWMDYQGATCLFGKPNRSRVYSISKHITLSHQTLPSPAITLHRTICQTSSSKNVISLFFVCFDCTVPVFKSAELAFFGVTRVIDKWI